MREKEKVTERVWEKWNLNKVKNRKERKWEIERKKERIKEAFPDMH